MLFIAAITSTWFPETSAENALCYLMLETQFNKCSDEVKKSVTVTTKEISALGFTLE